MPYVMKVCFFLQFSGWSGTLVKCHDIKNQQFNNINEIITDEHKYNQLPSKGNK